MLPISNEAITLFKNNARQSVKIKVNPLSGNPFVLTEADILTSGFNLNRASVSGETVEMGSVIASELSLSIDNYDGRFSGKIFEGARIFVEIGVSDGTKNHTYGFGFFNVDEVLKNRTSISVSALDDMVKFDKEVTTDFFADQPDDTYNIVDKNFNKICIDSETFLVWKFYSIKKTVSELVKSICYICGVKLKTDLSLLPNNNYEVVSVPLAEGMTYRQLLSWCCQIMGVCAFVDTSGELVLKWYTETGVTINPSDRYDSVVNENAIVLSKLKVQINDFIYESGEGDYGIDLSGNSLLQVNPQQTIDNLYSSIGGFSYVPFSAVTIPYPQLEPLDIVSIVKDGKTYQTIITNYDFTLNGATVLSGKGTTETKKKYSRFSAFTPSQDFAIKQVQSDINSKIEQTHNSILLAVSGTYATQEDVNSSVEILENAIKLKVSKDDVESAIEQSADRIRLKASKISWESDHSSLSEDGIFEAAGVKISGEIAATGGTIGGWNVGNELFFRKENGEDNYKIGLNPQALINVFYINDFDDKGNEKNIFAITRKGAITMNNNLLCTGVYASGAVVATKYVSSTEARAQRFFLIDDNGNTVGDDLQTQIDALSFAPGNVVTVPINTSFSGYVPYGKKGIHFLIPLSKPVIKKVKTVTLSGSVLFRGTNGALNGGNNLSFENEKDATTIEIINGVGLKVMINFASEITNAVNNDVVSVGTRTALTVSFA